MYKFLAVILIVFSGASQADGSLLHGEWTCKFESEYIDTDQRLAINSDKSYKFSTKVFMSDLVDIGKWSVDGTELLLKREIHIASNEKKESIHEFKHSITKLDEKQLVFTNGKGVSTCTK